VQRLTCPKPVGTLVTRGRQHHDSRVRLGPLHRQCRPGLARGEVAQRELPPVPRGHRRADVRERSVSGSLHRGALDWWERELLASVTSGTNQCFY
jgi:hypothetical protein